MTNVRKVTVIRRKVNPDPLGYPAWAAIVNLSTGDNTWTYWNTWPEPSRSLSTSPTPLVPSPTPIYDLLVSVMGPETQASAPLQRRLAGGEWDPWFALPARSRRRLIGARWATAGGMVPDVLADFIDARIHTDDKPLDWYYRTALLSIDEVRAARNRDRHLKLARRFELPSYYQYRTTIVQEAGYRSLWHYRQEMKWTENRTPKWKPRKRLPPSIDAETSPERKLGPPR